MCVILFTFHLCKILICLIKLMQPSSNRETTGLEQDSKDEVILVGMSILYLVYTCPYFYHFY
jgi:hypothetical protein